MLCTLSRGGLSRKAMIKFVGSVLTVNEAKSTLSLDGRVPHKTLLSGKLLDISIYISYLIALNNTCEFHCLFFQVSCIINYSLQTWQLWKQKQCSHDYRRVTGTIRSRWSHLINPENQPIAEREGTTFRCLFSLLLKSRVFLHRLRKNLLTSEIRLHW